MQALTAKRSHDLPIAELALRPRGLQSRIETALAALWRAMADSRNREARQIALPALSRLNDAQLHRLGHSASEIRDLRALAARDE